MDKQKEELYTAALIIKHILNNREQLENVERVYGAYDDIEIGFTNPDYTDIYRFARDYLKQYNELPTIDSIQQSVGLSFEDSLDKINDIKLASNGVFYQKADDYLKRQFIKTLVLKEVDDLDGLNKYRTDINDISEYYAKAKDNIRRRSLLVSADQFPTTITLDKLMQIELGETTWFLKDLIPEGLTILAGKPFAGKSFLAFNFCLAVAMGARNALGYSDTQQCGVLYLALEDNWRRLQNRANLLLEGGAFPNNLHVDINWQTADEGGIERLEQFLNFRPDVKFVVIDVLSKVRSQKGTRRNAYDVDVAEMSKWKKIADERHIALIFLHHTNKGLSDDPQDQISGTRGITGTADTILVLSRSKGTADADLYVEGRDHEGQIELALKKDAGKWTILGDSEMYRIPEKQQDIIECFRAVDNRKMGPTEIAKQMNKGLSAVKDLLGKLLDDGNVVKTKAGKYYLPDEIWMIRGPGRP
jgi:hypothetical protein